MGHDYGLVIPILDDFHFAWQKYGVFLTDFSPQRCQGIPVRFNPIVPGYSLVHLLSLWFNDLAVIVFYGTWVMSLGFFGTLALLDRLQVKSHRWFITLSWCLQGYALTRFATGHLIYIEILILPFLFTLLISEHEKNLGNILSLVCFSLLYAHQFYLGNMYYVMMFPCALVLALLILKWNDVELNYLRAIIRFALGMAVASALIVPRYLTFSQFTDNFPRLASFVDVGITKGIEYVAMAFYLPYPIAYDAMAGWSYGNWEAVVFVFPLFLSAAVIIAWLRGDKKFLLQLLFLSLLASLVASGVYAGLFTQLPFLRSVHVNPRWMAIFIFPIFLTVLLFMGRTKFPGWLIRLSVALNLALPFILVDEKYLVMQYQYHAQYDRAQNKLGYCYEPIFGYGLENFPAKNIKDKYLDPRCYIGKAKCENWRLDPHFYSDLEEYRLKPFDQK